MRQLWQLQLSVVVVALSQSVLLHRDFYISDENVCLLQYFWSTHQQLAKGRSTLSFLIFSQECEVCFGQMKLDRR